MAQSLKRRRIVCERHPTKGIKYTTPDGPVPDSSRLIEDYIDGRRATDGRAIIEVLLDPDGDGVHRIKVNSICASPDALNDERVEVVALGGGK